jgi:hypothetical protein
MGVHKVGANGFTGGVVGTVGIGFGTVELIFQKLSFGPSPKRASAPDFRTTKAGSKQK